MNMLSLRLFGVPDIRLGDRPLQGFVSSKAQALLIYLAVTKRRWNRSSLATLFWGDLSETAARRNLTKILSNLHQLVGDHLEIERHAIAISPDKEIWLDVALFEQKLSAESAPTTDATFWQEAVTLYAGDFLQGFHVANAPDFEEWMWSERERLRLRCCRALVRLAGHAADVSDLSQAIAWSQQLLRIDPTDEKTHRQLMTLFVRNGQRNKALSQYAACCEIVERELDVPSAPETRALYQQILDGSAALPRSAASPRKEAVPPSQPMFAAQPTLTQSQNWLPLTGRAQEWQRLRTIGQQTLTGSPHFCLICGEAGVGKTRLAEEMLLWAAENGIAVTRTRAYAAAGELAYAPIIDWLRSPPMQPALATLDEVWRMEIARLLPELAQKHPPWLAPASSTSSGPWQRQRLFDALSRAFQAGPQPKVLLLDDLQWCDGETVAWLHYFLQASQAIGTIQASQAASSNEQHSAPIFIVSTARPEILHAAHPLHTALLHLRSAGQMTEFDLAPLDVTASSALASQTTHTQLTPIQVANLYSYTEGNPLFIIESMRSDAWQAHFATAESHLPAPRHKNGTNAWTVPSPTSLSRSNGERPDEDLAPPPKMQAVIQERLAHLSLNARTLAGLAAVIGRSFSFGLLQHANADGQTDVVAGLDELWQQGIVRAHGQQQYDFSHDRIREVAYLGVSPVQRPLWHGQAAQALAEVNAADLMPVSAQLAFHYEQAGDYEQAIGYYQQAAERAHAMFADAEALILLQRSLELLTLLPDTRHRQELELSILFQMKAPLINSVGLTSALGELCKRAEVLCKEINKPHHLIELLEGLRIHYQMGAKYAEARAVTERLVVLLEEEHAMTDAQREENLQRRHDAYQLLASTLLYQGELLEAQARHEQAFAIGTHRVGCFVFSAFNMWLLGYPEKARRRMLEAWLTAVREKHPYNLGFAAANLARLNQILSRMHQSKRWAKKTIRLRTDTSGVPFWPKLGRIVLGRALAAQGKVDEGLDLIQTALQELDADQHFAFRTYTFSLMAEMHAQVKHYDKAIESLDKAMVYCERNGERIWHAELVRLRGEYRLALGAPLDEVMAFYQEAIAIAQSQQAKSLELRAATSLARLYQQQGDIDAAYTTLSNIYNWFTEGFKTADLQEARALLAELASSHSDEPKVEHRLG